MAQEQLQLIDILNSAIRKSILDIHTATVAKVTKVNEKTINVQVVINRNVAGESVQLPEFIEVPPVFMQGGGSYTAHPIAVGDYCLLIMTERCFDNWYAGRDNVTPPEFRTHDYSDAFAIVGINPLGSAITIPDVTTTKGDIKHEGNLDQTGDQTISGKNDAGSYAVGGTDGATGSFPTHNGGTVTVVKGIITQIV